MLSYSVLLNRFMWNTAPIISGLLFFTKRSQNYHTVFTQGVYYIDNETRGAELMTKTEATKLAGNRAVANAEEIIYDVPEGRIPVTDETLKNEIIKYALRRIGSTRIGLLDSTTLIYQDRWYNITVDNGNVTVDEV